ncbi:MAG: hypothetical protein ABWK53_11220 [Anaerolineales bacterium]
MRNVVRLWPLLVWMALLANACGGGGEAVGSPPAEAVETGRGAEVVLVSQTAFLDRWGRFHIVGEIRNDSTQALTGIELEVEISDAGGNSLLVDASGNRLPAERFAPMLVTLAPGEVAPFAYAYDMRLGTPDAYRVSVAAYQAGRAERANLVIERLTLTDDGRGMLYLTGEILNVGSDWAQIHALAGGVLDSDGVLLSADWTPVFMSMLAPAGDIGGRDRTPFVIPFPHPGAAARTPTLYVDADLAAPPPDLPVAVDNTNAYFDQYGAYHIVGALTNQTALPLDLVLVAGLYAADGSVLDAAVQPLPLTLAPGEQMPFEVASFTSLDYNPALAGRLMSHAVRLDAGRLVSRAAPVRLATGGEQVVQAGSTLIVSGVVENASGGPLGRITVLAALVDEAGAPLASGYAYLFPPAGAASIEPGERLPYEIRIEMAPGVEAAQRRVVTLAQGEVGR